MITPALKGPRIDQSTVPSLFNIFAETTSNLAFRDKVALIDKEGPVCTFYELANSVAAILDQIQSKFPGQNNAPIGLLMERSPLLVQTFLALSLTNRPILPLEPAYPPKRLAHMIEETQPSLILHDSVHENTAREFKGDRALFMPEATHEDRPFQRQELNPESLFAILYTSGTTGKPKGVRLQYRGILNRVNWMWRFFPFQPNERCCFKSSICVIESIWEIMGGLLKGIPLVIMPPHLAESPQAFGAFLNQTKTTRLNVNPSYLHLLLEQCSQELNHLQICTASGEPLPDSLASAFRKAYPKTRLLNLYGSTEVTADATSAMMTELLADHFVLGQPIDNTDIYLLDEELQSVAPGEQGVIFVAGNGVSAGYLGGDDCPPFFTNPDTDSEAYPILYRTGDLGKVKTIPGMDSPTLFFLGRGGNQVKIWGQCVQPAGIEDILNATSLVDQAAVVVENPSTRPRLFAFVKMKETQSDMIALRQFCLNAMPIYMQPVLVVVNDFPLKHNGEVDRAKLLHFCRLRPEHSDSPLHPLAAIVWDCWVLVFGESDETTNVFQLGGSSLQAVALITMLAEQGFALSFDELYSNPCRASLSRFLQFREHPSLASIAEIKTILPEDHEKASSVLVEAFLNDQLSRALGCTYQEYWGLFSFFLKLSAESGLCFVIKDGQDVAACTLSVDFHQFQEEMENFSELPSSFIPLFEMFDQLEQSFIERYSDPEEGRWYFSLLLAVPKNKKGYGLFVETLERFAIQDAKNKGYRGIIALKTHSVTRFMSDRLGYQEWASLDVQTWSFEGAYPFREVGPPNQIASFVSLEFEEP